VAFQLLVHPERSGGAILTRDHRRVEGFAVISEDGMLADAAGMMPASLKFEADQRFFECGLDSVDVVVHGRHSRERQKNSQSRSRIVVTTRVVSIGADPADKNVLFWNPKGATFEQAMTGLGEPDGSAAIIGGTGVFGLFLDRYSVFHLSRVPNVRLPGGRPVFPDAPVNTPEEVLSRHGLALDRKTVLDRSKGLVLFSWRRKSLVNG
jgi:dihydrofolate reductase